MAPASSIGHAKILAGLQKLAVEQEAAEWIEDNTKPEVTANANQTNSAHEALEKAVQAAATESEALLDLRLRGQVDDAVYNRKRLEIIDRQTMLRLKLEQPQASGDELLSRLQNVLQFSITAPTVFAKAGPVQRRRIVEPTTSNWTVRDREPLCLAQESVLDSRRCDLSSQVVGHLRPSSNLVVRNHRLLPA